MRDGDVKRLLFIITQLSAILALFILDIYWPLVFLGWILFPGFGSAVSLHRGLSHKTHNVGFLGKLTATLCVQGSPLWWIALHRQHHRFADQDQDPHSPNKGIFFGYFGWVFNKNEVNPRYLKDYLRDRQLIFLEKYYVHLIGSMLLLSFIFPEIASLWLIPAAWSFHQEAVVNVVCHYKKLRNIQWLGYLTWGQSIHKNHHEKQNTFLFGPTDPCRIFTLLTN